MNHRAKIKLARRISGKPSGYFESPEWELRKDAIARRVYHKVQVAIQRKIEKSIVERSGGE